MSNFWENDFDALLDDFGIDIVYKGETIKGIFDNEYLGVFSLDIGVESRGPQCIVKDSDVTGIEHRSTLTINSTTYYVIGIQPDGTGMTLLILSKD